MNDIQSKKSAQQPLEGEGSYSATRRYNQHLTDAVASGELQAGTEEARRAVDTPEGDELKRAADEAKRGPKRAPVTSSNSQANVRK